MIARTLLLASLWPLCGVAQIELFQFDGTNETPVGAVVDVGAVSPGDTLVARFRVRNIGASPVTLTNLALAGSGFAITSEPSLPYQLAPYTGSPVSEAEFRVAFSPTAIEEYNATLEVNTINVFLQGTGVPAAVLTVEGVAGPLTAGATIDFGSLQADKSKTLTFTLTNPGNANVTVQTLSVTGPGFRGPIGAQAPISLAPGQAISFQIAFEPASGVAYQGTLTVDQRSFDLTGQGLNPPLPGASIVFGASSALSQQQNNVSIPLAAASPISGTGTLTMEFHSAVAMAADDPAIQFLSGPTRAATITISKGDTTAKFDGNQSDLAFQTGTTAGTIVFTLVLNPGNVTEQASMTIAPAAVNFDTAHGVRLPGELDVSITAFDNTYSASQLAFTFYDKSGATMQPGVMRVDAAPDFRTYFGATQTGGAFGLLARFTVTGDTTQVAAVDVQVTNSIGTASTQRIVF